MMRRDFAVAGMLLVFGLAVAFPFSLSGVHWTFDSLYYEAQKQELEGQSQAAARKEVWNSKLASHYRHIITAVEHVKWRRFTPTLPWYSSFFRRRWTLPVIAAALDPLYGTKSLKVASLLGWALLAPLLFLLLRRRFSTEASVFATVISMFLPPVLMWASEPMTDLWALTILVAGLLFALMTREDLRWLPAWILAVLIGSFTRDLVLVFVFATGWLAFRERSRRMALVAATGLLASLPPLLLFPVSLQKSLTFGVSHWHIAATEGWGWILSRFPGALLHYTLKSNLAYPFHVGLPYSALTFVMAIPVIVGVILLFRSPGPFATLMRGAAVGGVATLVAAGAIYTELRIELVFVPVVAGGLALLAEWLLPYARRIRYRRQASSRASLAR